MDIINAMFELGGFMAIIPSILAVLRDKCWQGLSLMTPVFFTSWGFWNILYYPHLDQFWSACAAVLLTVSNSIYLALLFKYRTKSLEAELAEHGSGMGDC